MSYEGIILDTDTSGTNPVVTIEITGEPGAASIQAIPGRPVTLRIEPRGTK